MARGLVREREREERERRFVAKRKRGGPEV